MLKDFIRKNLTISSLIFLSLVIVIINFLRFFKHNSAYQFDPWLSNYQGGFVRRGLPGEFFYKIYELFNINPGLVAFIFVCLLYIFFYLNFFKLIEKIKFNRLYFFVILSPISFYFPILNSKATGHKEVILFFLLSVFCVFLPKIKRIYSYYFLILSIIFIALAHEGLIFFLTYLIIPFFFFYHYKNFTEVLFFLIPLLLIIFVLLLLNYHFRGTEQHVIAICDSLNNFINSNCKDVGQIAHLKLTLGEYTVQKERWSYGQTTLYPDYFIIYGIGFVFGFFPLFFLYKKSKTNLRFFKNLKIYPILILLVPFCFTLPVYYIAADWGRYLYISYMSSLIIIFFFIKNNIFFIEENINKSKDSPMVKSLFILIIIFYGFGWTVPICCEKKFKPGIFNAFDKIIYYYNKEK